MQPKVSIIVPVYNTGRFLETCIKSIVEQSFDAIEILVIDDGSIDNSAEICKKWEGKDKRVKYIYQKNQGVSVARNLGLEIALGEWIAFVDADDYISTVMIESLLREAERENDTDIIVSGYYIVEKNRINEAHFFKGNRKIIREDRDHLQNDNFFELIKRALGINKSKIKEKANIGVPWGKLYRKKFLQDYHLIFSPELRRMQDTLFNLNAFYYANEISYIDLPLYYYRVWEGSAVNRYSENFEQTAEKIIKELETWLYSVLNFQEAKSLLCFKKIGLLLEIFKLYYAHTECELKIPEKIENVKRLATSVIYAEAIQYDNCPYLNGKMKIFQYLLKNRMYKASYILVWIRYRIKSPISYF